jgi:hypothetical protein
MSEADARRDALQARLVKEAEAELDNIWAGLSDGTLDDDRVRGVIARTIIYGVAMPEVDETLRWAERMRNGPAMTREETDLVRLLAQATNRFADLPEHHPSDLTEWVHHVHALQNMLMARAAVRAVPEFPWTPMVNRKEGPPAVDTSEGESEQ